MSHINSLQSKIQKKEEEFTERKRELDKREADLIKRENDLKKRENDLKKKLEEEHTQKSKHQKKTHKSHDSNKEEELKKVEIKTIFKNKVYTLPVIKKYGVINIPLIGLGTSRILDIPNVVYNSIKDGLRLIDTAFKYANEDQVGLGIKKALEDGLCKREELFIIGKVWIAFRNDPEKAIIDSLKKLQLDYFDLYLDHWPSGNNYDPLMGVQRQVSIFDFWPKMESLVDKGLTRAIGVSNYNVQSLLNLLSFCKIRPVANEVEFHPYYYQENLKKFCDKENIAIIAHYPLARGNGAKIFISQHNGQMDCFKEECVKKLAEKYNKSPAQIIINWEVSQGIISIPGTSNKDRFKENSAALDFEMTDEDKKKLNVFGKKMKFCGCRRFFNMNIMA